jgi:hypothetical protein
MPSIDAELAVPVGVHSLETLDVEWFGGKRSKVTPFLGEEFRDRESLLVMRPLEITLCTLEQLAIPRLEVFYLGDRDQEIAAQISNLVFDVSFLVAGGGVAETDPVADAPSNTRGIAPQLEAGAIPFNMESVKEKLHVA